MVDVASEKFCSRHAFFYQALLERTGYTLDVTTGQRKYGGPPPDEVFKGTQPGIGTEVGEILPLCTWVSVPCLQQMRLPLQVFVGKIPRDLYEDELVPLFESAGAIWDLRLMMDPLSGQNRGYAFITYCNKDDAQKAVKLVSLVTCNQKVRIKKKNENLKLLFPLFFFLTSVTTMKSARANTWEFAYPSQTTACLLDLFLRIKPERVYWRILARLQVTF